MGTPARPDVLYDHANVLVTRNRIDLAGRTRLAMNAVSSVRLTHRQTNDATGGWMKVIIGGAMAAWGLYHWGCLGWWLVIAGVMGAFSGFGVLVRHRKFWELAITTTAGERYTLEDREQKELAAIHDAMAVAMGND